MRLLFIFLVVVWVDTCNGLAAPKCQSDTLFLVDSTGSVANIFAQEKEYIQKLLGHLDPEQNRVALIVYSSRYRHSKLHGFHSPQTKESIAALANNIPFHNGVTMTGAALTAALQELEKRRSGPANLVVITDGFSFDRVNDQAAQLSKLPNLRTFAVSVGQFYQKAELLQIAGATDRVFVGPESIAPLVKALELCGAPTTKPDMPPTTTVVSPPSAQPPVEPKKEEEKKDNGGANVYEVEEKVDPNPAIPPLTTRKVQPSTTVRVSSSTTTTTTASSTSAAVPTTTSPLKTKPKSKPAEKKAEGKANKKKPEKSNGNSDKKKNETPKKTNGTTINKSKPPTKPEEFTDVPSKKTAGNQKSCILDVVFVLDVSSSVHAAFEQMCDAAVEIYDTLISGKNSIYYGVVRFSGNHRSKVVIPMGEHNSTEEFRRGLHTIRSTGGTTYIVNALRQVEEMLHGGPNHKTLIVVITDGFIRDDPEKDAYNLKSKATVFLVPSAKEFPLNRSEFKKMASQEKYAFMDRDMDAIKKALNEVTTGC